MSFIRNSGYKRLFVGGVGTGKTTGGAMKSLLYCINNPGAWGYVTAPQNHILDVATIPKYEQIFPNDFVIKKKYKPHAEWWLKNGCKIFFWSTDKPETISGSEIAFCHMDEGSLSPYQAYVNIKKRMRQMNRKTGQPYPYQIWVTTTPRQLNWLYQEVTDKLDPMPFDKASIFDNIYLDDPKGYVERMGLSGKEYEQEVMGEFVSLAGECLFSDEVIKRCLNEAIAPIQVRDNGLILIYREPVVGVKYICGADCSDEGGGGVNNGVILDPQTGFEMAEVYGDIPADRFASVLYNLCSEYNYPLLAPERNGTAGGIVVQKLRDLKYPNLYYDDKGAPGWYTTTKAIPPKVDRHSMLLEYEEAIRLRRTIVSSSDAVGEMSTFVRDKDGKFGHREGCKDDRVMARAITWQLRKSRSVAQAFKFHSYGRVASSYMGVR